MLITTRARGCSNDSPCGKVYCNWCWDHRKALGKLSGTPKPKLTATGLPEGHSYAVANPEKLFRCCRAFLEAYVLAAEASRNSVITEATVACSICGYVLKLKDGVWNR